MVDVVADPHALDAFASLAAGRLALESEASRVAELHHRVVNGSLEFGVARNSLGRLDELFVEMERQENYAAAVRDAVLAADTIDARGLATAPTDLVDGYLATRPSGRLWAYDSEIALIAAESGLSYEEAYFAIRTHQIDVITVLIAGGDPDRQLVADRRTLVADLAMGDAALTDAIIELLDEPPRAGTYGAAEAAFDAPGLVYGDGSIEDLVAAIDDRLGGLEGPGQWPADLEFDPFLLGLGTLLADKLEAAGPDAPTYLGGPITDVDQAAVVLGDREVFGELETAAADGDDGAVDGDGRLSMGNVEAVLAEPGRYSRAVVELARFLAADPAAFASLDAARDGTFLHDLVDGDYHVGRGDGVVTYADAVDHPANRWVFDTLLGDLDHLDANDDGVLDEVEFTARLADLDVLAEVREAINYALERDVADGGDVRPTWLRAGSSALRIGSLFPSTPLHVGRSIVDLDGLTADSLAALRGAGGSVVGVGQFVYDAMAATNQLGLYHVEAWRVDGDLQRHRGVLLSQSVPVLLDAGASVVPGTTQWSEANEAVDHSGTWDDHPGISLGRSLLDEERFFDDPGAWAGSLAPDLLITAFTGGGGAITRTASTATRVAAAARRFVVRLGRDGARAALRHGVAVGAAGLRNLPARAIVRYDGAVDSVRDLPARMQAYDDAVRWLQSRPGPIDFTARRDPFGRLIDRRLDVDPDGYFDVVAHGNAHVIEIAHSGDSHPADALEAADLIRAADDYRPGQPVRLISCSTGCLDDGFAAQLTQELDASTLAADDFVWAAPDGSMVVSRAETIRHFLGMFERRVAQWPPTGSWRLFHPDGTIVELGHPPVRLPARRFWSGTPDRSHLRRDPQELIEQTRFGVENVPPPPVPNPALDPPSGMTTTLIDYRSALDDPRAVVMFDERFDRIGAKTLETVLASAREFPAELIGEWLQRHPTPVDLGPGEWRLVDRVLDLVGWRQEIINKLLDYADDHPDVEGIGRLLKRLSNEDHNIKPVLTRKAIPTTETARDIESTLRGALGELDAALEFEDVVDLARTVTARGERAEVDVVADGGATWVDAKTGRPFTTASSTWDTFGAQADRLVRIASRTDLDASGTHPVVVYDFRNGVTPSVKLALVEVGRHYDVEVIVRGDVVTGRGR